MDKVDKFREIWSLNKHQLKRTSTSEEDREGMEGVLMYLEEALQENLEDWKVSSSYFLYDDENDYIVRQFTLRKGKASHFIVLTPLMEIRGMDLNISSELLADIMNICTDLLVQVIQMENE
jgi:hypothetical protein|tara:strand:- start:97 stop:459 length:363 start_codon:yes stop_codon:yes gene_type:complete